MVGEIRGSISLGVSGGIFQTTATISCSAPLGAHTLGLALTRAVSIHIFGTPIKPTGFGCTTDIGWIAPSIYIDGGTEGDVSIISGTQGYRVVTHQVDHYAGTEADLVCGEGGNFVGISRTILRRKCFIGKFTKQEGSIGMGNFALIGINSQSTACKFQ